MCGIAGTAGFVADGLLDRMLAAMVHRGPDSRGAKTWQQHDMCIGMRRLAIIDIEGGGQPRTTPDGAVTLVFNGEIYNHIELREELRALGHRFTSRSDTEVVLHAYLQWGPDCWGRLRGMFAVAVVDLRGDEPALLLARDPTGIKPLYFTTQGGRLLFASEMKCLLCWEGVSREVRLSALREYLLLRYVPGPGSLLEGIRKLPAGHWLRFQRGEVDLRRWWSPPEEEHRDESRSPAEAARYMGDALRLSVRRHMIADVPVGAFLSGGIDSGTIVALMAETGSGPLHTFSIGFPGDDAGDMSGAAAVSRHLGTTHHAIECTAADFADLPSIVRALDEPVGDAIVVPMYVLAREARKEVKVVLSGEGADEMLGGYMFHRKLTQIARLRRLVPGFAWKLAAASAERIPAGLLDLLFDYPGSLGRDGRRKVVRLLRSTADKPLVSLYREAISLFDDEELAAALRTAMPPSPALSPALRESPATPLQELIDAQYADWLPDDILMKADKMSMAHSLEARVPFMDQAVIDAAARLTDEAKLGGGRNKRALRDFAAGLLPESVVKAPKRAFYLPLESYVRSSELEDIVSRTLDPARLRRRGLFDVDWIASMRETTRDAGFLPLKKLFAIVMLELWFEEFCPDASWA